MTAIRGDVAAVLARIADDIDALATLAARPDHEEALHVLARQVRAIFKPMVPCVLVQLPEPDGTAVPDFTATGAKVPYWRLAPTGDRLFVADAGHTWWTSGEDAAREWLEHDALAMLAAARWTTGGGAT